MAVESEKYARTVDIHGKTYKYYYLAAHHESAQINKLPYSIRILLESAIRNCNNFHVKAKDVENIINWPETQLKEVEIPFQPSRVILQDFTGVPAVVDFAAMRDAVSHLGANPQAINPVCPADLVIDHSVQVDIAGSAAALEQNQNIEFERNIERFRFLKWGAKAFRNMLIVPPGAGIVHQVNLEYLARLVFGVNGTTGAAQEMSVLYPDSVVGTDSHTTMINGLGILGWGVGGIEAEAVMLGQPISMVLPEVIGYRLTGHLHPMATATDLVLTITSNLRKVGVVGKFVEFFGPGVDHLSIADRATVANMCPEYGATCGYFPVDQISLDYLTQTGRNPDQIQVMAAYMKANLMFRESSMPEPLYSRVLELDLAAIVPCIAGPKRPHDLVPLTEVKRDFDRCLQSAVGFKGFGIATDKLDTSVPIEWSDGSAQSLTHGDIVIASITSCTNTSNPSVMLGAGLLAKKAVEAGLKVKPHIKTSLSPGSGVVTAYLQRSGLLPYLEQLGFHLVGYGCMTCIGNSGPLPDTLAKVIEDNDLVVASVLSGNRNFEGRVHPLTRANYLASPPLVIAYALLGNFRRDLATEALGTNVQGQQVFLKDIWPTKQEVDALERQFVLPEMFREVYTRISEGGSSRWSELQVPAEDLYPWDPESTYIKSPPFFEGMTKEPIPLKDIERARVLLNLGDSVTTDHISPAGSIARNSPAARYLGERGVTTRDFNSYGARRGNDDVMARGTFANVRLVNKLLSGRVAPRTTHLPDGDEMDVFDAAERYRSENVPVIILAGREYGSGSSRDWAAKGPWILGVRAVIAESYERIHRSNLIGMGIVPLQFAPGQSADTLRLTGHELYTIRFPPAGLALGQQWTVELDDGRTFSAVPRFDTEVELTYFRHGGILQYMARKIAANEP